MVQPSGAIGADAVKTCCPWMLIASDVGSLLPAPRRLNLRKPGHVGVTQHQADIGMRDQAALIADDIRMAVLADLDLRNHIPDQLEIDLGDADAGVLAGPGQRECHVGLGVPAKVNRAVIDLVGDGFGEFGILGEVDPAVEKRPSPAADTRSRSLPVASTCASSVIAGTCRNSRSASNRRGSIARDAVAGVGRGDVGRPWQLGGPADLAFDLLDELADLGRRRLGLFALDADQGRFVLRGNREKTSKIPLDSRRDADHRDEQGGRIW